MPQKDPHVERVIRFIGYFASQPPSDYDDEAATFCEALMSWLLSVVTAKDKTVRTRACQLLSQIVNALPEDAGLDEVRMPLPCPYVQYTLIKIFSRTQSRGSQLMLRTSHYHSAVGLTAVPSFLHEPT